MGETDNQGVEIFNADGEKQAADASSGGDTWAIRRVLEGTVTEHRQKWLHR